MPKMATFRPPGAEKLIFSDKTLPCSIDCAPKHIHGYRIGILDWYLELTFVYGVYSGECGERVQYGLGPKNSFKMRMVDPWPV